MRKVITSFVLFLVVFSSNGQNVGINTNTPHPSAALDISDSTKGILIPRMTMVQRNNIQNPAEGLMVYQTDSMKGFWSFDGLNWRNLSSINTNNFSISSDSSLHLFSTLPLFSGTYTVPANESWKVVSIHKLVGFGATIGIGTFQGCTAGSPGWNNTRCGYSLPSAISLININDNEIYYGSYNSSSSVIELGGYPPCSSCPPTAGFNFTFESNSLSQINFPFWLNSSDVITISNNLKLSVERYK
jgi:hypothetical protein